MSEITPVGHWKEDNDEIDVYCGRSGSDGNLRHLNNTEVGERGWLGNPFTLDEYSREESISRFRGEFEKSLSNDQQLSDAVAGLKGKTLGCWCRKLDENYPACHCDVIAEWADRLGGKHPEHPGHNLVSKSCNRGEHNMVSGSVPTRSVCSLCGLGSTTLVDQLGHSPNREHREEADQR